MNWYKLAEAEAEAEEVTVTPDQFQAMGWEQKWRLARNESISLSTQKMFFTEKYKSNSSKDFIIQHLVQNPSFLKDFTLQELREFAKTKEARYIVYKKRLKTIRAMVLL